MNTGARCMKIRRRKRCTPYGHRFSFSNHFLLHEIEFSSQSGHLCLLEGWLIPRQNWINNGTMVSPILYVVLEVSTVQV
ncbi:unnamed protein product [Cuscuta epithymum]|uniref:Uncharacterized protein n=1 Tax=Cuscuta epithymum TaxID=186058 RepID=A0AAV0FJS8_9ASTE|nr:unnamed protein product [Cuscuta epithymum]